MTVLFESGYTLPAADEPLTKARIAHANNWLSGGTASASTTESGFDADALLNSLTYERWAPAGLPATWEYNHGSSVECDYCCIGAHDLGTNGVTLQVQYYEDTGSPNEWVDLIAATAITTDEPIFVIFTPVTKQRWRIRITGAASPDPIPEIGVVKFGKALQMQRGIFQGHAPLDLARQTILRSNYSETGEFLGRTKQRNYHSTSYTWSNLRASWVRSNWPSLQKAVETEPFFIAWRPDSYETVGLCQTDSVPIPENTGPGDLMSVTLDVRARGYD